MRTPSSDLKYLALAFGLVAVTLGGACGSSESSSDAAALNRDGMAGSTGHDGAAGVDGGSVVDTSIADTAKADVAVDVSLGSEAGKPVDAGVLTEVGAVDASASEAGRSVDAGVTEAGSSADAKDSAAPTSTANLIVNGDAEAAVGSADASPVATPGWTVTAEATAIQYGASGGYPVSTDPGPTNRGLNFFAGGRADQLSTLTQTISLEPYASALVGRSVTFTLSAYLGGFSSQEDNAVLSLSFRNADGAEVSTASIGPVTAADRGSVTGLLPKSTTGTVPAAARSVIVTLTLTRLEGSANDGYADNLSLVLTGV